ncbi:MAG: diaminobutyrate--2-oxoglutarate transaminase [Cyclobacteriaceae bacterium]
MIRTDILIDNKNDISEDSESSTSVVTGGQMKTDSNKNYIERQEEYESNARSYPRRIPIAIKKAEGLYVTDADGKEYIDCLAGAGSIALGHNHPVMIDAIKGCLEHKNALLTLDLTTPVKDRFVEKLFSVLPADFSKAAKVQFCSPSGADAVEASVKLAKIATGRSTVFAFSGSYHGVTNGALALTGNRSMKEGVPNLMKDVAFLPFPYHYRCPFGIGGEAAEKISLSYIESLLKDSHSGVGLPAAFIIEAVQGEGGAIPASPFWMKGIREITAKYDIPLILDEVQAGIGRTGHMFAFEDAGITPDIIVISKAIGGSLPLSLVVYNKVLDKWNPGAHAGTFRGNQMAMAAGTAVLDYIAEHDLVGNAREKGKYLQNAFQDMHKKYPFIGEVRGRGLMIGLEIVDVNKKSNSLKSYPPNAGLASKIQQECFKNGLIVETGGRQNAVLRLLPPLNLTDDQADEILTIFGRVLHAVSES